MLRKSEGNFYQFWIASSSFFESTLFFSASTALVDGASHPEIKPQLYPASTCKIELIFSDADGAVVNECVTEISRTKITGLELAQFMEGFKNEAGLRHGLVTVKSESKIAAICRINSQNSAALMGALPSTDNRAFFPVKFGEGRSTLLAIVNLSREVSNMKCKLYLGKRNPEIVCQVPAGGVRLLSLESEFSEYAELGQSLSVGYVRVTPRQDLPFAAQLLERIDGVKDEGIFTSLT